MNRFLLILLSGVIFFSSCKKDDTDPKPQTVIYDSVQRILRDVKYGDNTRNVMDIYLPANRTAQTPFVLLIHGGSWVSGNKEDFNIMQDTLMRRGIASASMSYRYVSPNVNYEDLMDDVDAALKYCITNYESLNIRNEKYSIGGVSAGAHMAMLYGYRYDNSNKIANILSLCGPTDLTDVENLDTLLVDPVLNYAVQHLAGVPYVKGQPLAPAYQSMSPIYHVNNKPLLMVYGDKDELVLYHSQAQPMDAKLTSMNYTHKFVTIPGAGHDLGFSNPLIAYMILNEATNWIKNYSN